MPDRGVNSDMKWLRVPLTHLGMVDEKVLVQRGEKTGKKDTRTACTGRDKTLETTVRP